MKINSVRLFTALTLSVASSQLSAATLVTRFTTDPLTQGWQAHGTNNLFTWDSTNQNLRATWDSSKPNNYFHLPLNTTLTRTHGFMLTFDLTLSDMPNSNGFQIAIGLLNLADATATNFFRGSGSESPNIAEFDFFPDSGFGASYNATLIDANNTFAFRYDNQPLEFGTPYHIELTHLPGDGHLSGQVFTNGQLYTTLPYAYASPGFSEFELDTLAISSYSDVNGYGSSILAHGAVDNIVFASPLPVSTITPLSATEISLASDAAWNYTLESTTNLTAWAQAAATVPGNGGTLVLQATNAPADASFYRVRADLP